MGNEAPARFVPSTEELLHWVRYGINVPICVCDICTQMRSLGSEDK